MFPFWPRLPFWNPFGFLNKRREADPADIQPEEIIDLTQDDDDESAFDSALEDEPSYDCPICMTEVEEPVATWCGHVFCSECLESALAVKNTCPFCNAVVHGTIYLKNH